MSVSVIVWDTPGDPPQSTREILCWDALLERDGVRSIPRYVETHADRLRSKYLAFVYDLGQSKVNGRRVVDHLNIDDGLSFWWLTLLAEKSPLKSPRLYCCIRLFALEEILCERKPVELGLVSADRQLAEAMRTLCRHLNIHFVWRRESQPTRRFSVRRVYRALPLQIQAIIVLARHIIERWRIRRSQVAQWFSNEQAVFMCSYLIHLDPVACASGHFVSRHWGVLPHMLRESGRRVNWVHHFLRSSSIPDAGAAVQLVERFNRAPETEGYHALLDRYLSLRLILGATKQWLRLNAIAWRMRSVKRAFRPTGSGLWLWPVLRADWRSSLLGPVSINNCLWIALFDAAFCELPHQSAGFYLYENQGWERAMLHAWRKHGHGEIIAVQHATAPFWHLYYFQDRRTWSLKDSGHMPMPDRVAVNGPDAWNAFVDAGYPVDELVKTEALRYLNLADGGKPQKNAVSDTTNPGSRELQVLILGDMIPSTMDRFLALVEEACDLLPAGYNFTFKPHPGYSVDLSAYPRLRPHETTKGLDGIISQYDVTVAANSTSAAVDAFAVGVRVIIMLDGLGLNLSPLRGHPGVEFVSTPAELASALMSKTATPTPFPQHQQMFYLDPALPRWRDLLASAGQT